MSKKVIEWRKGREESGMNTGSINHILLKFDGSTSGGNPGNGGCGVVCYDNEDEFMVDESSSVVPRKPIIEGSRHLGRVSSNVAEYYGVIFGLRQLLQDYPILVFDLTIQGDSELVIRQLMGKYKVESSNLLPLYHVAMGLIKQIVGKVTFEHIPREQNRRADLLAKHAATTRAPLGHSLVFYPSLMNLLEGSINGRQLVVGNDAGTAALTPEVLFDATTILEAFGSSALEKLKNPGKTTKVKGKVDFTVLGILSFPVTFTVTFANGPVQLKIPDVVVVDFLPYDVQLSVDHPQVEETWSISSADGMKFQSSSVPRRFQDHPYWNDDRNIFIASM